MAAGGTSSNIELGAGRLYVAPLATTEPTDASTAMPSAWDVIGYTEAGSTITFNYTTQDVEVAEELYPVLISATKAEGTIAFQMAEATRRRLALAFGAGAGAVNTAASFTPPTIGTQVSVMMAWQSEDVAAATTVRWVFRKCFPTGAIEIRNQKAPNKKLIPVSMRLLKPDLLEPFIVFPNSSGLI